MHRGRGRRPDPARHPDDLRGRRDETDSEAGAGPGRVRARDHEHHDQLLRGHHRLGDAASGSGSLQPGAPRSARAHRPGHSDGARSPDLRPAHCARPDQGRVEPLPRRRRRCLHRDGVRDREALRRRRGACARQRRAASAARASGSHGLAHRTLQPQRLLRAAPAVVAGVEPHTHAARGADARHRRLQARQRRPRPRRRRRAAPLPRRGAARDRPAGGRHLPARRRGVRGGDGGLRRRGRRARCRPGADPPRCRRLPRHRPDDRLGRACPRPGACDEPPRARGVRRGRHDDGESAGKEPGRPLRRGGDEAARRAGPRARRPLDRASEDAAEPDRQAQPAERRAGDRRRDRGRAPVARRLPQLPRLRLRRRRAHPGRLPRRPHLGYGLALARHPPQTSRRGSHGSLRRARRVDRRRRRRELRVRAADRRHRPDRGVAARGAASLRDAGSSA